MRPRARIAALSLITVTALTVPGLPARAATTCAFDPPTAQVTITAGNEEDVVLSRSGDALHVNGADCDTATVTNTDAVQIYGGASTDVTLDMSRGSFAPGKTPEDEVTTPADDEIELTIDFNSVAGGPITVLGTPDSDTILAGEEDEDSLNLNGSEAIGDADVTVLGMFEGILLDGGAGDDRIDLASGTAGPNVGNQDAPAGFENAVGSEGNDVIFGDDGPNVLEGGEGFDILTPGGGDDHVEGGAGADMLDLGDAPANLRIDLLGGTATGDGNDTITDIEGATGGDHDDVFIAGPELAQGLDGRDGVDTLDLSNSDSPADVDLLLEQAAAFNWNQSVLSFESIVGTSSGDILRGSLAPNRIAGNGGEDLIWGLPGPDTLTGGDGDDILIGGSHHDSILGGSGMDTVTFEGSSEGVVVDLLEGSATGQGNDALSSIESAGGTDHDDRFVGTPGANTFWGEAGFDTIDYRRAGRKVRVNLNDQAAAGDGRDQLMGFERVLGSRFADVIRGDAAFNVLVGRGAADRLRGMGGGDRLAGNLGSDGLNGGRGNDACAGGPGRDELVHCE